MPIYGTLFTFNNYSEEDVVRIKGCVGKRGISYVCFGREVGPQCGTPHLQGYLQGSQKQFSRLQEAIGKCAMFSQKGTSKEAIDYCKKDNDFYEAGEAVDIPRPKGKGARSDLEAIQKAIENGESYDDICSTQFETAAKFSRFIKERVQARDSEKQQKLLSERYESAVLRPWQTALVDILNEDPNPRTIHWIWENQGNVGKSWMANYLGCQMGATILTAGKKVDMAYIYAQKPTKIVVFDLSRTNEAPDGTHFLDGIYSLAENMKDGRIISTKYESKTVFFPTPHVVFFANFAPDMTKWSADRYFIKHL